MDRTAQKSAVPQASGSGCRVTRKYTGEITAEALVVNLVKAHRQAV